MSDQPNIVGALTDPEELAALQAAARRLEKTSGLKQRYGIHEDGLWFSRDDFIDIRSLITAWIREHPADAPKWYSVEELYHWLKVNNYSEQIATELAALIAPQWQLAFNKGFSMARRGEDPDDGTPTDSDWLMSIGFGEERMNGQSILLRTVMDGADPVELFLMEHDGHWWATLLQSNNDDHVLITGKYYDTRHSVRRLLHELGMSQKGADSP